MTQQPRRRGPATRAVHGPDDARPAATGSPVSTPIVHSTTFAFPTLDAMNAAQQKGAAGAYYQRLGHPTLHACERRLADLDGAEGALLFSSGAAALGSVFLASLRPGDHIVVLDQCYGGTLDLLRFGEEHLGWKCDHVDARTPERWSAAFRPETRLFHVESPTNPLLSIVDLAAAAELAHARGARLVVDNTFASPVGQHPLALGADFVMYSATKSIGGHADVLAGVVTGSARALEPVWKVRKLFGPVPDPEVAWRIERSVKTLPLRVRAANANALELATRLASHDAVQRVLYPGLANHERHDVARRQMSLGFGPVLAFEVAGGLAGAEAVANAFRLVLHAPSLGGVESLASLPAWTSHIHLGPEGRARAGIPEGLVRLSVGIEDVEDLWADVSQAIAAASAVRVG
jgi:cystathionine gamma-synthase